MSWEAKRWLVDLKRPAFLEFLWSLSLARIILRKLYLWLHHRFSRKLLERWSSTNSASPFRWDFQYFCVNSSLKWRRSRLTAAKLQALYPSPSPAKSNFAIRRFRRPKKAKNTIHESIKVSLNFIEIFRPRYWDIRFLGIEFKTL